MEGELDFTGMTALVTGSGRNIGRAVALEFAERGANVVINARSNRAEVESVASEVEQLGAKALVVMGEPADRAVVERIHDEATRAFGGIDIYVSNAARRLYKTFFETSDDAWHYHLNQQLTASWHLAKVLTPYMIERGWGRIIHINGPDAVVGGWTRAPHSAAKAALRNLTKTLADGLGEFGITVNDVSPGFVDTKRDFTTHPDLRPELIPDLIKRIPIRRQPRMSEVAWACAFLASRRSDGITGAVIQVDGGQFKFG